MKFVSKKEVRDKVLYSFAHIARMEAAGTFPKRVQLGAGRVGWVDDEIDGWIKSRIALRDAHTGS